MCDELIADFRSDVLDRDISHHHFFFRKLKDYSPEQILCFCRWIVREFEYTKFPALIKDAYKELAHRRDLSCITSFRSLESKWKNTYYNEYQYLSALFSNAEHGAECNCTVYQDSRFNAPPYHDDIELISHSKKSYGLTETDVLHVRCKGCGREYIVEIDYVYHYPHSHWQSMGTT